MFTTLAVLIGVYSYLIFFLGVLRVLDMPHIRYTTGAYAIFCLVILTYTYVRVHHAKKRELMRFNTADIALFTLIAILGTVNFIGAVAPELAFDALWYHLTIPKIYLRLHEVTFIPGGVYYYSLMPKLTEMYYAAALSLSNETAAKLIHFGFGIMACIALFKLSRRYLNRSFSLLCIIIFMSNLVFAWESTTAYIDLTRTFFEVMAFTVFIKAIQDKKSPFIFLSAALLGFAISAKLLAAGSIAIFIVLCMLFVRPVKTAAYYALLIVVLSALIPLPWFVLSFYYTKNPVYPFFTPVYSFGSFSHLLNPFIFVNDVLSLFMKSQDPVSPLYLIVLPLVIFGIKKLYKDIKVPLMYCGLSICAWYVTPHTGGGRFILPYLPMFSLIAAYTIYIQNKKMKIYLIAIVLVVACVTASYRMFAQLKYIPVLLGKQTKADFLCRNLNFKFQDFYDCGNQIKKLTKGDTVLIYGAHNMYYADFPFVHFSTIQNTTQFRFILTQYAVLPNQYIHTALIYENRQTGVKLYHTTQE